MVIPRDMPRLAAKAVKQPPEAMDEASMKKSAAKAGKFHRANLKKVAGEQERLGAKAEERHHLDRSKAFGPLIYPLGQQLRTNEKAKSFVVLYCLAKQ